MIDYEKLRLAEELLLKYSIQQIGCLHDTPKFELHLQCSGDCVDTWCVLDGATYSLWELIIKLQSLTQDKPKPKYAIGDTLYGLCDEIYSFTVSESYFYENWGKWCYADESGEYDISETSLYPSKQALIEAQILHWQNELIKEFHPPFEGEIKGFHGEIIYKANQCPGDCEWDGVLISRNPNLGKCKKCGETCFIALSSCCSVHAGTTDECFDSEKPAKDLRCSFCDRAFKARGDCPIISCSFKTDTQRNQDEVDLHGCQHESDGKVWIQQYADMSLRTEYFKCKKCGELYK